MDFQKTEKGFNIAEIVQSGSLGHGTAIPGKYDIDLVIYSRGMQLLQINSLKQGWQQSLDNKVHQGLYTQQLRQALEIKIIIIMIHQPYIVGK